MTNSSGKTKVAAGAAAGLVALAVGAAVATSGDSEKPSPPDLPNCQSYDLYAENKVAQGSEACEQVREAPDTKKAP